jgi:hypothetical protein
MMKWLGCVAIAVVLAAPAPAVAGELRLSIANGRVTIVAQDVTVRQILDEWQRVGQTTVVGADKLAGTPVTLELNDVAEGRALETLLRSASGYIAKPRTGTTGASAYGSILIMPASRAPAVSAAPPPPAFTRPQPQVVMPNVIDEEGEPQPPIMPPGAVPAPPQQYPGQPPQMPVQGQPMPPGGQQVPAQTLPRPGMLPPPTPGGPGNPYQTQPMPAVRPPGVPGPGGDDR